MRKIWTTKRKTGKTGTNFMYWFQFDKTILVLHVFMSSLRLASARNFQSEHFDFRKSALGLPH